MRTQKKTRLQQLPREQNKDADALANKAMDTKSSETVITSSIAEILAPIPSSPAMSGAAPASSQPASPSTQPDCNLARDPTPPADIVTCVVELNQLPTAREVSELASQIHLESRVLCALSPSTLWSEAMKHRWTQACAALTPKLKAALDDGSDLSLMQALLDTTRLPLLTLARFVAKDEKRSQKHFTAPDPLPATELDGGNPSQRRAKNKAWQDLWSGAMQELLSNGSAPQTQETFKALDIMHRKRLNDLHLHAPQEAQEKVTTSAAKRFLYRAAAQKRTCLDVFGWAADFLLPIRNTAFLRQFARLVARIGSADIPGVAARFLTAGGLIALYKEDEGKRRERKSRGQPQRIRPVNVGSAILKWGLQLLLKTPGARDAAEKLQPIQMALGVRRGPEKVAHLFRALWEQKYAILSFDFENGFNNFIRQAMMDAVEKHCPSLTKHFSCFYVHDSLCFFIIDDVVQTLLGKEGSRMGCL